MEKISFFKLSFYQQLFAFVEAAQYCFSDYHNQDTEYAKTDRKYWNNSVKEILTNDELFKEINSYKESHLEELNNSPILQGLLDMCIESHQNQTDEGIKNAFDKFQELQKALPFDSNKQSYFEAGCRLYPDMDSEDELVVIYPLFLYSAYVQKGGIDDDHSGGFLFPKHKLSTQEVIDIHKMDASLFNPKTEIIYNKIAGVNKTQQLIVK